MTSEEITRKNIESILEWMVHFADVEDEIFREVHGRFKPLWDEIRPSEFNIPALKNSSAICDSVLRLDSEHPEFVRCARAHWALMALFEGENFKRNPREKKWENIGGLPPMLKSLTGYPEDLDPSLVNELNSWAEEDRTMDGKGLGFVGRYGSGKCQCAVGSIRKMFEKHPFKGSDEESLGEPKYRTASFFRAAQISTAVGNLSRSEDSYEYHIASTTIEYCRGHEVLLVAGIGEIPMDISASSEFLNILQHRRLHHRPTVWTTQFTSAELEKRFNCRLGRLIVERLSKDASILKLA